MCNTVHDILGIQMELIADKLNIYRKGSYDQSLLRYIKFNNNPMLILKDKPMYCICR